MKSLTRWRGPATILAIESPSRIYVSWNGVPFLYVPEQLRPCSAGQAQFDDILRKLTSLRCELHVADEQLGFVDSQHPGPSTALSTDAVPTMYEQTVYRICPGRTPPSTVVNGRVLNERVLLLSMLD